MGSQWGDRLQRRNEGDVSGASVQLLELDGGRHTAAVVPSVQGERKAPGWAGDRPRG
jgi:hypothetical protein